ncbi:methyltransferase FkbM family [Vulcanisaeta moutnovskia 768-28]|uniref:Methyltransferase FkbM family n=1 Tax=Vulcanisaeta moutnovskia (strain 768-28) TaxID=985053 RepID=F0QSD4_VULM7|nr:FkbM family methyltransferase [Vulcanisaeta moutnovskia]ADY00285.1 methyltransferase FkbM family [Vulcanisaeta moutnovskia 768-28]
MNITIDCIGDPEGLFKRGIRFLINVRGVTLQDEFRLLIAALIFLLNILFRFIKLKDNVYNLSYYIPGSNPVRVRYHDENYDVIFIIRPRSGDFYDILGEHHELNNWLASVLNTTKNAVIVDVGAYIGGYTVRACRRARRVIAIEPLEDAAFLLRNNIELNGCNNVIIVKKAIWKEKGRVSMKVVKFNEEESAIDPSGNIIVESDTLDNVMKELGIDHIDFLKIDIEGAEAEAIHGMNETLRITRYLMIELRSSTLWVINELNKLGFKVIDCVNYGTFINVFFSNQRL